MDPIVVDTSLWQQQQQRQRQQVSDRIGFPLEKEKVHLHWICSVGCLQGFRERERESSNFALECSQVSQTRKTTNSRSYCSINLLLRTSGFASLGFLFYVERLRLTLQICR